MINVVFHRGETVLAGVKLPALLRTGETARLGTQTFRVLEVRWILDDIDALFVRVYLGAIYA